MKRIVIVGGGVAGLSLAFALDRRTRRDELEIVVLEANARCGGNIRSEHVDGYTCEHGPNGFLDSAPETLDLVRELGIEHRLQVSSDAARRRFIFRNATLHELAASPLRLAMSGLLSWRAKLRIVAEPFAAPRPGGDESIHDFASRRIGHEAADVLIDSMVSGVFAGDAHELSLQACFPRMHQLETEFGGLFRAMWALRQKRQAGRLTSFKGGMEDLIESLAQHLSAAVRTGQRVVAVQERDASAVDSGLRRFTIQLQGGPTLDADGVALTGPARDSAAVLAGLDAALANELRAIQFAPLAVVCLGYDETELVARRGPLDGFGFLIPRGENIRSLGVLWDSSIYPGRAAAGRALLRVMIGGARDRGAVDLSDAALLLTVRRELAQTMSLDLEPSFVRIVRHRGGIPQYTLGHLDRVSRMNSRLAWHSGLQLSGSSYRGVAINSCVAEAQSLAGRMLLHLETVLYTTDAAA